jgi:hypothetical protein
VNRNAAGGDTSASESREGKPMSADKTHAAILLSTGLGLLCLAAAPVVGALCAALVERIVGLAYSLGEGKLVVRVVGAVVAGAAIAALINGIVFTVYGGRFAHGRVYLVTLAIAVAAYAAIVAGRAIVDGELVRLFVVSEWRDSYVRLTTGLYLLYGPGAAVGYAPVFWLFHLLSRSGDA